MRHHGYLTWDARMKVLLGTAKAPAYLHEATELKVVHLNNKSSNILIDDDFNAKVSDFGLVKLLGAGKSHGTTRVMGTFGCVALEYANSGLLNLIKEVVDPDIDVRPSTRALKQALMTALRCVDPDSKKRSKMGQVARILESEEYPIPREDRRHRRTQAGAWKLRHRGNMLIPTRVRTRVQDLLTVGGNRAYKSLKLSGQWDVYSERVILSKKFELLKFLGLPT
ncbi:Kinase family protein [Quillaja saponaria]|uniref:non-specific serine/threonine protein kinase n=1 Tax=Quillaja saponaria TaxID=32244 RepID=A0AAD7Q1N0_QUISA|nr:Kinase family protein [Quillaja saponaria]